MAFTIFSNTSHDVAAALLDDAWHATHPRHSRLSRCPARAKRTGPAGGSTKPPMNLRTLTLSRFAAIAIAPTLVAGCEHLRDIHDVGFDGELWNHSKTAAPNPRVRLFKPASGDDGIVMYVERH